MFCQKPTKNISLKNYNVGCILGFSVSYFPDFQRVIAHLHIFMLSRVIGYLRQLKFFILKYWMTCSDNEHFGVASDEQKDRAVTNN